MTSNLGIACARYAALTRSRPADDPALTAARAGMAAERLRAAIHANAAVLTPAQRDDLATVLLAGGDA
ncbi:hypothetical protein [Lolliginicoccus suaedae]|uniref:hypothetical protein n=1 Tax=Lolliginicoccus suaedae TaxID=2605429 RepID=UPI0011EE71BC|nr:hypothetical protein [Lolliginicoccus suaedae]